MELKAPIKDLEKKEVTAKKLGKNDLHRWLMNDQSRQRSRCQIFSYMYCLDASLLLVVYEKNFSIFCSQLAL